MKKKSKMADISIQKKSSTIRNCGSGGRSSVCSALPSRFNRRDGDDPPVSDVLFFLPLPLPPGQGRSGSSRNGDTAGEGSVCGSIAPKEYPERELPYLCTRAGGDGSS